MIDNYFIIASNLYCMRAITKCINERNAPRGILLVVTMYVSMIYHAIVSGHDMPGGSPAQQYEHMFELADTTLTSLLIFTFILQFKDFGSPKIVKFWFLVLLCLAVSEMFVIDTLVLDTAYMKLAYALTHSLWHLALFHVAYLLVKA